MDLRVRLCTGKIGIVGRCLYREGDLTLLYDVSPHLPVLRSAPTLAEAVEGRLGIRQKPQFFVIADTLTLTFEGADRKLRSLDAYTNKALWKICPIRNVPSVESSGTLHLEQVPEGVDRCSLEFSPRYELSADGKWVRIVLSDEAPIAYYEIASNLLAGLNSSLLTELVLVDLAVV